MNTLYSQDDLNTAAQYLATKAGEGVTDWSQFGRIYSREKDDLVLLNYTAQAQYEGEFSPFEMVCRGLVLSREGKIVARPFDKFFNWGERGMYPSRDAHLETVTTKMDGSLIIVFWHNDRYMCVTRGSFDSIQAQLAQDMLDEIKHKTGGFTYPSGFTYLFELIHPDNRIVINYAQIKTLYLLAVRDTKTGRYISRYPSLYNTVDSLNIDTPVVWSFNNPTQIVEACGKLGPNGEGYVAEFSDGTRWKFKGDEYLEIAKMMNGMSKKRVAKMMYDGTYAHAFDILPVDLSEQIIQWAEQIEADVELRYKHVLFQFDQIHPGSRKDFAQSVNHYTPAHRPYLFMMFDGVSSIEIKKRILNDLIKDY